MPAAWGKSQQGQMESNGRGKTHRSKDYILDSLHALVPGQRGELDGHVIVDRYSMLCSRHQGRERRAKRGSGLEHGDRERERRKRALSTEHRMVSGERAGEGCVRARRGAGGAGEGGFMRRARQTLQPDVARGRQPMETRTGPMGSRAKWRAVRALEMNHEAQATRWRKAWRAGLHFRRDPLI